MKAAFLAISLLLSFYAVSQFKKDKFYRKVTNNISEVKKFKEYLLSNNYHKGFTQGIVYSWQNVNDPEIKRFCRKFNVRTIHIIPKPKYPTSADHFVEDDNRIDLFFNTIIFFGRNRALIYDCSDQGLKLKSSIPPDHKIDDRIYFF
jgi:hypothetical protein